MSDSYADWRDRLARANDPRFWPIAEIDRLLVEGQAQFWGADHGALVTRVVHYPGGAVAVEGLAAAGTAKAIQAIAPKVEAWAIAIGANRVSAFGRTGWAKRLPPGWRHHQSIFIKDLADGREN